MARLYSPIRINLTYTRDDEVLESRYYLGTSEASTPYGLTPTTLNDLISFVEDGVGNAIGSAAAEGILIRCIEVEGVEDLSTRVKRKITRLGTSGNLADALPANTPLVLQFRGTRDNKPVVGGPRLSVGKDSYAVAGRLTDTFIQNEGDAIKSEFLKPWPNQDVGESWRLGIYDETRRLEFISADQVGFSPVLGSMIERTGNRPQGRPSRPSDG